MFISDTKVWDPDYVRYNFQNRANAFPRQCKHDIKESIYKLFLPVCINHLVLVIFLRMLCIKIFKILLGLMNSRI